MKIAFLGSKRRRLGRWLRMSLALAVVFGGVPASAAVTASAQVSSTEATGTDSSAAGPLALEGAITRDGKPAAADILVVAWPNQKVFDGLVEGDDVKRVTLASTVTGASGSYAVSIDPAAVPTDYISDDGWVDIEVWAADASTEALWATTLANVGGTWANAGDVPSVASGETIAPATPSISIDLVSGRVTDTAIDTAEMIDDDGKEIAPADGAAMITTSVATRSDTFDTEFQAHSNVGVQRRCSVGPRVVRL
jgi:hypothetical protein